MKKNLSLLYFSFLFFSFASQCGQARTLKRQLRNLKQFNRNGSLSPEKIKAASELRDQAQAIGCKKVVVQAQALLSPRQKRSKKSPKNQLCYFSDSEE